MHIVESIDSNVKTDNKESKYSFRMFKESFFSGQAFGIEVERQDLIEGNIIKIERDSISKISNNEEKVRDLLKLLFNYKVSPIHLVDILGDYVDSYVSDFNI